MDFSDLKGMFSEVKVRMDGAIDRARRDMASVRTGRATVSILDSVHVEAYGARDTTGGRALHAKLAFLLVCCSPEHCFFTRAL